MLNWKTVKEKLDYGDYLIYTDACVLYRNNSKNLVDYINNKKADMWVRQHIDNLYEKDWTKRDTFIIMGLGKPTYADTNQYDSAFQIYRKTPFIVRFLEEYLYFSKDKRIITDDPNVMGFSNYDSFKDNRHDQSVLSLLVKKYHLADFGKQNITINKNGKDVMWREFCQYRKRLFKDYNHLKRKYKIYI